MNDNHAMLCATPQWAAQLHADVLAPLLAQVQLGTQKIEVGPGPGAATEWLRHRVGRLVAVEADPHAARTLTERYAATNVEVVPGDATELRFPDAVFDAAGSFTMLHHVPTVGQQQRVLAELARVLRPGGVLVGSDSLASDELRWFHEKDTYNPVEPAGLLSWLQRLGLHPISITVDRVLTFLAYRPHRSRPDMSDPLGDAAAGVVQDRRVADEPAREGEPGGDPCPYRRVSDTERRSGRTRTGGRCRGTGRRSQVGCCWSARTMSTPSRS